MKRGYGKTTRDRRVAGQGADARAIPRRRVPGRGELRPHPRSAGVGRRSPDEIKKKKWGRLGVDTDGDFTPYYVVPTTRRKHVAELKAALKGASEVLLATDPDREGESISWHLHEVLKPKVPVKRIVFHEITEEAVNEALEDAHDVDENLVRAQESRRILDRLYGYTLSPVLWKKVQTGLSAGRVQSVAVRLIVEREEERLAFRAGDATGISRRSCRGEGREFVATLARIGDQRVATGKDFDAQRACSNGKNVRAAVDEADAARCADALDAHICRGRSRASKQKPGVERPAPPFTTSTLHAGSEPQARVLHRADDAGRRSGCSRADRRRWKVISYHRTDSTTLSDKALGESARVDSRDVRRRVLRRAAPLLRRRSRTRRKRTKRSARPTSAARRSQLEGVLDSDDLRIYELIWKRTMASQMVDARVLRTTVEISGEGATTARRRCSPRAARRSSSPASAARTSKAATIRPRSSKSRRPSCRSARSAIAVDRDERDARCIAARRSSRSGTRRRRRRASPKRRSSRSSSGSASAGRRPTRRRSRTIERRGYVFRQGKALVPELHGVRGDAAAARAFRRLRRRRLHRGDGGRPRRDLARRARVARVLREFYRGDKQASRPRGRGRSRREENADYPLHRPRRRSRDAASRSASASGASARSCSSARAARAAPRRCRRRHGAGGSHGREGAGAGAREGRRAARRSASIRRPA